MQHRPTFRTPGDGPFANFKPVVVKLTDPPEARLALATNIGITIHLSESFSVDRRSNGRSAFTVGKVAQAFLDSPESHGTISVRGSCRIIQLCLPTKRFTAIALEDHGIDADGAALETGRAFVDFSLLRLLCTAATQPDAENETARNIVAHLLTRRSVRPARLTTLKAGLTPTGLRKVINLVDDALASVSLGDMASEASLSPFHFSREFKRSTGQAPWSYVVSRRVAHALTLLPRRDLSLNDIAANVGFAHASHLNRHLQTLTGLTAMRLRRTVLL